VRRFSASADARTGQAEERWKRAAVVRGKAEDAGAGAEVEGVVAIVAGV